MKLQKMLTLVRKCVDDYNLIEDGDKIAVGISGGKDSISLLVALKELSRFYPKKFEICAITISLGLPDFDLSKVQKLCKEIDVEYKIVDTQIGEIIFDVRKEKNPCSLCSKMRKGAIVDAAKSMGCNKLAYGHNRDDVIQTLFMSMFYAGKIHTFTPSTYLDGKDIHSIKPLIYVPEKDVVGFVNKYNLPVVKSPCTVDGYTKREEMKNFVKEQRKKYDKFDEKIFNAIVGAGFPEF